MEFTEFGWRDVVVLAVVAAVAYLLVTLVRLLRLSRTRGKAEVVAPVTRLPIDAAQAASTQDDTAVADALQFAEHLSRSRLEQELKELRAEVADLRAELSQMKAVRRVSPLYADATALAQRGYDAKGIAGECGISVAEAELVLAMSDGSKTFDDEVNDGGSGQGERVEPRGR